jgi:hypothetical protein
VYLSVSFSILPPSRGVVSLSRVCMCPSPRVCGCGNPSFLLRQSAGDRGTIRRPLCRRRLGTRASPVRPCRSCPRPAPRLRPAGHPSAPAWPRGKSRTPLTSQPHGRRPRELLAGSLGRNEGRKRAGDSGPGEGNRRKEHRRYPALSPTAPVPGGGNNMATRWGGAREARLGGGAQGRDTGSGPGKVGARKAGPGAQRVQPSPTPKD